VQALVERSQGVYIVADDLQIVKLNGHLQLPSFGTPQPCVLIEPVLPALDMRPEWLGEPLFSESRSWIDLFFREFSCAGLLSCRRLACYPGTAISQIQRCRCH
jgi:hypothetical protein